jgi:tetratricopeptide (TPR) repeat protein
LSLRSGKRLVLPLLALTLVAVAGCRSGGGTRPAADRGADDILAPESGGRRAANRAAGEQAADNRTASAATADSAGLPAAAAAPPVDVPEQATAGYARGLAAMNAGNWFQAEVEFEQLIVGYPDFPGPYVNLAILYRRDNRTDAAATALAQALAIVPTHAAANSELGIIYRERGDFSEAEAAYRQAIAGNSDYALAHYNLGVLYDLYMKREAEALEQYEIYLSLVPAPDPEVERWVVDLRRRLGLPAQSVQVAQGSGPIDG